MNEKKLMDDQEMAKVVGGISEDEALDVALQYVGLKKDQLQFMKKPKIDWERGTRVYEIKFYHGGFEYEFDVDCESGKIVKFEKDWDD